MINSAPPTINSEPMSTQIKTSVPIPPPNPYCIADGSSRTNRKLPVTVLATTTNHTISVCISNMKRPDVVLTGLSICSEQKIPLRHRQNLRRLANQQLPIRPYFISFGIHFHLRRRAVVNHVRFAQMPH